MVLWFGCPVCHVAGQPACVYVWLLCFQSGRGLVALRMCGRGSEKDLLMHRWLRWTLSPPCDLTHTPRPSLLCPECRQVHRLAGVDVEDRGHVGCKVWSLLDVAY